MIRVHETPIVGSWYWDIEHSLQFEIVASDAGTEEGQSGTIEIQYFDGEVEELDLDEWFNMQVVSISAPKDWTGPYEVDKDEFSDLTDDEPHHHPLDKNNNPLDSIE